MQTPDFDVHKELEGWTLLFAGLSCAPGGVLSALCRTVEEDARARLSIDMLSAHPPVAEMRKLFRAAGCDPTRYRPSSEALLRRLLKGDALPAIHPLVDFNNCLSATLAVPCCVMAEETLAPPFVLRAGVSGESYESLRGPFRTEGKPLLCDTTGPLDTPITGNERVKVTAETTHAWLVAYLPAEAVTGEVAREALEGLVGSAGGVVEMPWCEVR